MSVDEIYVMYVNFVVEWLTDKKFVYTSHY